MSARTAAPSAFTLVLVAPVLGLLAIVGSAVVIAVAFGGPQTGCGGAVSGSLKGVPAKLAPIYEQASARFRLGPRGPSVLAAINFIETDFGQNLNTSSAGAEGWMQFIPETWASYGVDGDGDGDKEMRDPWDAIFSAANYLHASGAPQDWHAAILAYNHAEWYVADVLANARKFSGQSSGPVQSVATCAPSGSAQLRSAQRLYSPRLFKPIPPNLWVGYGSPESVDARIWPDAVWLLNTFGLRVTAAREAGHETHGDGTALDMAPAAGRGWDGTALRAALALGWTANCGWNGAAPVCPLMPAIQFVGYNGYPHHGDPWHGAEHPHLHVSWKSSEYGCRSLCAPREWVMRFPLG